MKNFSTIKKSFRSTFHLVVLSLIVSQIIHDQAYGGTAKSNDCRSLYSQTSTKKTIAENVIDDLRNNPNGMPLLLVSNSLMESFREQSAKYESILKLISAQGPKNKLSFAIRTTNQTIESFQNLLKKLSGEVEKNKQKQKKINELTSKMKTCVGNLNICESNLTIALRDAQNDVQLTKQLIAELQEKLPELDQVMSTLKESNMLSAADLQLVESTIARQKSMIGTSYISILEKNLEGLEIFKRQAEIMLSHSIQHARFDAAQLQSSASIDIDALSLGKKEAEREGGGEIDFNFEFDHRADLHDDTNNKDRTAIENAKFFQEKVNASEQTKFSKNLIMELNGKKSSKSTPVLDKIMTISLDPSNKEGVSLKDLAIVVDYLIENDRVLFRRYGDIIFSNGIEMINMYSDRINGIVIYPGMDYWFLYFLLNTVSLKEYISFLDWSGQLYLKKEANLLHDIDQATNWIDKLKLIKKLKRIRKSYAFFQKSIQNHRGNDKAIFYNVPKDGVIDFKIIREGEFLFRRSFYVEDSAVNRN